MNTDTNVVPQLPRIARRSDAQAQVNLSKRRSWFVDTPQSAIPDQTTLDYVNRPLENALKEAQEIASDKSRTKEYIRERVNPLFAAAREEIEQRHKSQADDLDEKIRKFEATSRIRFAPDAAEAPLLLYMKAALEGRASSMTHSDLHHFWEQAITDKDKPTLRVLRDFHARLQGVDANGRKTSLARGVVTDELLKRTDRALMSSEQAQAADALLQARATREAIDREKYHALKKIASGFIQNADGTIVDALSVQREQITQRMIRG